MSSICLVSILVIFVLLLIVLIRMYFMNKQRIDTFLRLCNLPQKKIDLYLESYDKIFNDQGMVSCRQNYLLKKPPAKFVIPDGKQAEYTENCYSVLSDLCKLGNVEKMFIPLLFKEGASLKENQLLEEKSVAESLNLRPGGRILEIGCGCGIIAKNISNITKCKVTGINIDDHQLNQARGLSTSNEFLKLDLNAPRYPFEDNTFDGIYTVQGMASFTKDMDSVMRELQRILKPGGRFVMYECFLMDDFDSTNRYHMELLKNSRRVMAGGTFNYYRYMEDSIIRSGLQLLKSEGDVPPKDLALLISEHSHYHKIESWIRFFTKIKILPKHMIQIIERLRDGGDDLVKMMKLNLITMNWFFIAEKR